MSDADCGSWCWSAPDAVEGPIVFAAVEQVLTGLLVGHSDLAVVCAGCRAELREGQDVIVYAYRRADAAAWDVVRCYCEECEPEAIETPTLGTTEVLANAVVGVRSFPREQVQWGCLGDVAVVACSPPTEGTPP